MRLLRRRRPASRHAAPQLLPARAPRVDPTTLCADLSCHKPWTEQTGPEKWATCLDHVPGRPRA